MSSTDPDAARTATGYDMQEIVLRGALESGDILGVRVMPEKQIGRYHETAWKLYEADRIVSPANHNEGERWSARPGMAGVPVQGNVVAGGVEVDEFTAPIAYHVLKAPPNGFDGVAVGRMVGDTVRLDAWGEKTELPTCVHVMSVKRPEQFRGASVLAPVLEILQQVSTLTEAEAFAAVLTSMIAIIYKGKNGNPMPEPDYGTGEPAADGMVQASEPWQTAGTTARTTDIGFEVGSALEIDSEDDVEMKSPGRPNPAFEPFFKALAQQIAAAAEVPYEVLMLAFNASYSASRGALEVFYLTVRKRRNWLASHWCTQVYRAWLFEQVAKGRYRMPGFLTNRTMRERWWNVRFRGDGKISLDPAREAKALEVHEAHAWSTGAEITAELNGGDYDANVERRAGEHRRFVEAGLPIPNQNGGGSAPAADQPEPKEVPA
jgi:lambda family phage portal protein